ncbi:MAG: hypothetical protein AB7O24_08170 [Kofleriaceae bacterium]
MNKLMIALALAFAGAGCKENQPGADLVQWTTAQRDRMCKCTDAACVEKVTADGVAEAIKNPGPSNQKLDEATQTKVNELTAEMIKCMEKLAAPAMPPAPTAEEPAAAAPAGDLPPECGEWKATVDKLGACDKIAADNRKAMKQTFDNAAAKWATMTTPEQRKTIAEECKSASEMMKNAVKVCL